MKTLFIAMVLFGFQAHSAQLVNCKATEIFYSPLEESFSVEEYPEVSVASTAAWIGSSLFEVGDGAAIYDESTARTTRVTVVDPSGEVSYEILVNKRSLKGKIMFHTTNEEETELMATLVCR